MLHVIFIRSLAFKDLIPSNTLLFRVGATVTYFFDTDCSRERFTSLHFISDPEKSLQANTLCLRQ
jgi:hypothetical protein